MGQNIGPDIVATLTHNAGVITLPPSLLTLGGRQFRTAPLSQNLAVLSAHSLAFVYVYLVAGVPTLLVNTSLVPSTLKLVQPTAKLVGAFYANASGTFGAFVTIEGVPTSNAIPYAPTVSGITGFAAAPTAFVKRVGDHGEYQIYVQKDGAAGVGVAGVILGLAGQTIDTTKYTSNNGTLNFGHAELFATAYTALAPVTFSGTNTGVGIAKVGTAQILIGTDILANQYLNLNFRVPIVGWSNTPLKDL